MIDRDVSARARDLVRDQKQDGSEHDQESSYRAVCESLPVLLRTAGFARTVTFLATKKGANETILEHLRRQLESAGFYSDVSRRKLDLIDFLTSSESSVATYRHISSFSFRIAYWHKRMAQALLRPRSKRPPATEALR